MKNFKIFGEVQTASYLKKIIQSPTRLKLPIIMSLEQIFSYGDIQESTDICFPKASRLQFLDVQKRCSANAFTGQSETWLPENL